MDLTPPNQQGILAGPPTPEAVTWAYKLLLGRAPENIDVVQAHARAHPDVAAMVRSFLESREFHEASTRPPQRGPQPKPLPEAQPQPPAADHTAPIRVGLDVPSSQLDAMMRLLEGNWEMLGRAEPHWSVLVADEFKSGSIAGSVAQFYESGRWSVDLMNLAAARCGADLSGLRTCFELGCGVGRVTWWLARQFPSVTAADISGPHLDLARQALAERGVTNAVLKKIGSVQDLASLPGFDCFYSLIVLQHNPPPVIHGMLDIILGKLNPGGLAFFQVPTYCQGYVFDAAEYLSNTQVRGEMEVHVLPQVPLFGLLRKHGCSLLEIREDGCVGHPWFISNSLLVRKAR